MAQPVEFDWEDAFRLQDPLTDTEQLDRGHDRLAVASGHLVAAPLLVLWSRGGPLDSWYAAQSGPLELWRAYALQVEGGAIEGGHFFPEQNPAATLAALRSFLAQCVGPERTLLSGTHRLKVGRCISFPAVHRFSRRAY